jgi:4-hydroxyproline epimerase
MCGHGTIGLVATLAHTGRIKPGTHRIETPVGVVTAELHENGEVSVTNVPAYRKEKGVRIGDVVGDVAWGGNWFFLVENHGQALTLGNVSQLLQYTSRLRIAVNTQGFPEVDHVELVGPGSNGANARNFVLCPGGAYDRSPCGTGTSAKLACLAADGKLAEGEPWVQESILGTRFVGRYRRADSDRIVPTITGSAYVNAEATLILDESDPFCWGIRNG